jgi:hypothetical protein
MHVLLLQMSRLTSSGGALYNSIGMKLSRSFNDALELPEEVRA